ARGDYAQPLIESGKLAQKRLEGRLTQPSLLWTRWILERFQAIQNQQGSTMRDQFSQSFALLPGRSNPRIRIPKPSESRIEKFIRGRSLATAPLSVEGPAINELRRTVMFCRHPLEPMVNERRLSDTSPGNDGNDVDILVCPCTIQKRHVLFSTKNIASGNGQFGYGNFLGSEFCWRLASSDTRTGRGRLLQALASDST